MNKIRIALYLSIAICCIMFGVFELKAQEEKPSEEDTGRSSVVSDSLTVFSRTSSNSTIVKNLKMGDVVTVEYEIEGAEGAWCGITEEGQTTVSGYVQCKYLKRQILQKKSWEKLDSSFTEESTTEKPLPSQPLGESPKPRRFSE
jgi:hypothetical protein